MRPGRLPLLRWKGNADGGGKIRGRGRTGLLGKVVELHTQHYKDDFDIDKELIQNLAACKNGGE